MVGHSNMCGCGMAAVRPAETHVGLAAGYRRPVTILRSSEMVLRPARSAVH